MNMAGQAQGEPGLPEQPRYLVMLAAAPAIFITHFVLAYALASVWCAKLAPADGSLSGALGPLALITLVALAGVLWIGWGGYRRHRHRSEPVPHDEDTPADRHRFLGLAALLLAGLSGVAIVFVTTAFLAFDTCQ